MAVNYKQLYAIKQKNTNRIKSICQDITNNSGIYIFSREEKGIRFAYIGQSLHLLDRCVDHLSGFQHIDNSIKKHGLYDELKNPTGYKLWFKEYPQEQLDTQEQFYIKYLANKGYQLKNKTIGGQGVGKDGLENGREPKGYRDGLKQGYENARKEIAVLFDKYLDFVMKDKPNKIKERKFEDFRCWLTDNQKARLEHIEEVKEREKKWKAN